MIGWLDSMLEDMEDEHFGQGHCRVAALNVPPRNVGRGLSETLSIPSTELMEVCDLTEMRYLDDFHEE